jgi:chemotaxis protein histidine kinase CheA
MLSITTAKVDDVPAPVLELFRAAVNLSVLDDYEGIQLDGEPDIIIELIELYLADAPRRVAAMQESAARRDWQSVKREAHSLRGSSGSLGAVEMAQICAGIEEVVCGSPGLNTAVLLRRLELGLQRALHAFLLERERRRSQ